MSPLQIGGFGRVSGCTLWFHAVGTALHGLGESWLLSGHGRNGVLVAKRGCTGRIWTGRTRTACITKSQVALGELRILRWLSTSTMCAVVRAAALGCGGLQTWSMLLLVCSNLENTNQSPTTCPSSRGPSKACHVCKGDVDVNESKGLHASWQSVATMQKSAYDVAEACGFPL